MIAVFRTVSGGRSRAVVAAVFAVVSLGLALTAALAGATVVVHPYESQITEAAGAPLGSPFGLAVDSAANLYVADGNEAAPALDKFDSSGAPVTAWGTNGQITQANGSPFTRPYNLALDGSGNLWLADQKSHFVDKFEPNGTFALQTSGEGRFSSFARGVAFSTAAQRLFVADSNKGELWVLKPDGSFESEITGPWGSGCCFIYDAADNSPGEAAGDIYVNGEGNAVYRIHGSGPEVGEPAPFSATAPYIEGAKLTGGPSGPFGTGDQGTGVRGLAVDSAGNLYVAAENGVFEFGPNGKASGRITGTPTGPAGAQVPFGELTAVGVGAASGHLYVGDSANHVVDVFGAGVPLPEVATKSASAITTTSATFNGEVNPEGFAVEECTFEWGTSTAYGHTVPCEDPDAAELGSGTSPVAVHAQLTNLPSGATIHFRLAAKNVNGANAESGDQEFLTGTSVDATWASEVSAGAATLNAEINPHGLPAIYRFEYLTEAAYLQNGESFSGPNTPLLTSTASAGQGSADVLRSAQVQGLQPLTTYHYRVVATNALGTSAGPVLAFTTQGPSSALLPDGRAWEMVTPPNKHGAPLQVINETGALIEAAADGSAFTSVAHGPLGPESQGNRSIADSQLLSVRGPSGWTTTDITTPHEEISAIEVGEPSEYKFFAPDLSSAIVEPAGVTPLSPQTTEPTPYRRLSDGSFDPLLTASDVPPGTEFAGVQFVAASPDAAHLVLESRQLLTEEFQPGFHGEEERVNLYEQGPGGLRLASVLPDGEAASEAGLEPQLGTFGPKNWRGAISADGERLVFEANPNGERHLYLRDNATEAQSTVSGTAVDGSQCTEPAAACTIQLDAPQPGATGGNGGAEFQAASEDGSRVFFTDESRLTADSTAGGSAPDLYMCEIELVAGHPACVLTDLSVSLLHPAEPAAVFGGGPGYVSVDAAGAHVYFTADGVLTATPNSQGEVARPGDCRSPGESTCNLYVADTETGAVHLVAVLSTHDGPDWGREGLNLAGLTARSSPDGRFFTFMSTRPLTGYDNRDAKSGQPDAEVYLYDTATGSLTCASCDPTGARPLGVFDPATAIIPHLLVDGAASWGGGSPGEGRWLAAVIPGWTSYGLANATYQSRYISNSGRLFFNSSDALVPQDTNGVMDVYEYEPPGVGDCTTSSPTYGAASGGCVSLISSGTSPAESAFLDASESGDDVFFLTKSRLVPKDFDSAFDVYDAAVGGGEPQLVKPPECSGDACQQPAVPPNDPTPGSLTFQGAGNLLECPKGKVKQGGRCVAKKAKRHSKKHKKSAFKHGASSKRGGAK